MTEEQANEMATRLTIALMEQKQWPFDALSKRTPEQTAAAVVPPLLAMRDALLQGKPTTPS